MIRNHPPGDAKGEICIFFEMALSYILPAVDIILNKVFPKGIFS